jgi:transposase
MSYYAGIDVSLEQSSVCVMDGEGKIIREAKVASEPEALIAWFGSLGLAMTRIGLEAGPLSQWLFAAMKQAGLELLETRHVRNAFKTMPVKTDRKDARGIAELMRMGWFRPVHCKSISAQETRAILTTRTLIESKLRDVEMSLRGVLRGFGLKVGIRPRRPIFPNGSRSWSAGMRICKSSPMRCWLYAKCCCASSGVLRSVYGRWRAMMGERSC